MAKTAKFPFRTPPVPQTARGLPVDVLPARRSLAAVQTTAATPSLSIRGLRDLADVAADMIETTLGNRGSRRRWVVREAGSALEVMRVTRGASERLATIEDGAVSGGEPWRRDFAKADIVELRLDPETIVRQRFTLPAESRAFAAAIVEHRLDRLTPWKADDVIYGYTVRPGAGSGEPIEIDFAATSRDIAAKALERVARLGRAPTAIGSAADPASELLAVDLLGGASGARPTGRHLALRRLCLAILPLSIAAFLGTTLWQAKVQGDLDTATAALDLQRRAVQSRIANDDPAQAIAGLLATKTMDGATFVLIDRLSRTIPDGTFLTDIEISPTLLHLKGRSTNALALVPILEGEAGLTGVRFESPVIREANGGDRFDIVATREIPAPAAEPVQP
jgi:general secretion pathway protein L